MWWYSLYFAFLLQAVIFSTVAEGAGNLTQNSSRECAICHFRWIDQFIEGHGSALVDYEAEDVAGDEMMCFSCHDGSTEDSRVKVWLLDKHKTGMKPSDRVKIPKLFPLSANGDMMCSTCHSAHSNPTDTSIERSIFLRIVNNDSIMCEMCHVDQLIKAENHPIHQGKKPLPGRIFAEGATPSYSDINYVICESCHTAHGGVEKNLVSTVTGSTLCIICHGDKVDVASLNASERVNHSLFVKFKVDPARDIIFQHGENDTLQCLTCHKVHLHVPGTKSLVAEKSILCPYCHFDKDRTMNATVPQWENHPLSVTFTVDPAGKFIPDGGDKKIVQCFSCHTLHQHVPGTKGLAAPRDILCVTCHAGQSFVEGTDHDLRITFPEGINNLGQKPSQFGVCSSCHVPHKAVGPFLWSRTVGDEYLSPSSLCLICHGEKGPAAEKGVGRFSHPVTREMKEPPQLPLYTSEDGRKLMECHTCHDPHRWRPGKDVKGEGKNVEGDESNSFLRQPVCLQSSLCSFCHADHYQIEGTDHDLRVTAREEINSAGKNVEQAGVCSSCHIPHNGKGPMLWARTLTATHDIPTYLCLSCHTKKGPAAAKTVGRHSHRVGIAVHGSPDLPLYRKDEFTLVMECSTCHDPHKWTVQEEKKGSGKNVEGDGKSSFLRKMNQEEPFLCLECHQRQGYVSGTDHDMRVTAPESVNLLGRKPRQESVCSPCHGVHNANSQTVLWNSVLSPFGKDFMARACYGCHSSEGTGKNKLVSVGTHPERYYFGYHKPYAIISQKVQDSSEEYQLFDAEGKKTPNGEITCPTCHDPHIWKPDRLEKGPGENLEGTPIDSFLRRDVRSELCYTCHGIKTLFLYRYYHEVEERRKIMGPYSPSSP